MLRVRLLSCFPKVMQRLNKGLTSRIKRGPAWVLVPLLLLATLRLQAGTISGFNLKTCGTTFCVTLTANQAFVSTRSAMSFAFDDLKLELTHQKSKASRVILSRDAFFDGKGQKIFLRQLNSPEGADAIFDFATEELKFF